MSENRERLAAEFVINAITNELFRDLDAARSWLTEYRAEFDCSVEDMVNSGDRLDLLIARDYVKHMAGC